MWNSTLRKFQRRDGLWAPYYSFIQAIHADDVPAITALNRINRPLTVRRLQTKSTQLKDVSNRSPKFYLGKRPPKLMTTFPSFPCS